MSEFDRSEWHHMPMPTLMRAARGAYAQSIRAELHVVGIDNLPRNAIFILSGIDSSGPSTEFPAELGITKQGVSLVIDTLVKRGYLERSPDADDRRRIDLTLTDRGHEAVDVATRGVEAVDHKLEERFSHEQINAAREVLIAMSEIKSAGVASGTGRRRPRRGLRRFEPIFPVRNLDEALAHYRSLGFSTTAYEEGDFYGFANRDGVGLHLELRHDHDHDHEAHGPGSAYLYVRDADALFEEWSKPGIAGHTRAVETTPYELREGSHVDPDGNLIRFGSPIDE
jgi:DNA-binding MarR family transcriptional regulator